MNNHIYDKLPSSQDNTVAWVYTLSDKENIECRYVKRDPSQDYSIAYISSQTGCNQACRMCHLTQLGHNKSNNVSEHHLMLQLKLVLDYMTTINDISKYVYVNFMARGEPLLADPLYCSGIMHEMINLARSYGRYVRFNISTIMPSAFNLSLIDTFYDYKPVFYYSMYSTDEAFRRKWLPRAMPVDDALPRLKDWQNQTMMIIKIHHAYIAGENDSDEQVNAVIDKLNEYNLRYDTNIVRYNPADNQSYKESDRIDEIANTWITRNSGGITQVKPRVGFDVKASCGMFYDNAGI